MHLPEYLKWKLLILISQLNWNNKTNQNEHFSQRYHQFGSFYSNLEFFLLIVSRVLCGLEEYLTKNFQSKRKQSTILFQTDIESSH
jgi:hypothetical protein